ncbi:DUF805 domain-containing protein [Novosphingobium sp. FSW06-99]|uniref:DUF805 domain-containing protein n=1 Tax=Novosphingobium sp. FSW06-99 TaxID=1739113 RepID=UPI00076DAFF2|nr:DUF805 domain-containing protein [Novosphingobium sp. FSW06-99]KUR75422.1 hypothetical protein AQZ49_15240 [Novosphingobium sp. FSW06-99]
MDYVVMPYRRYADFLGRSSRKEYWLFVLFEVVVFVAVFVAVVPTMMVSLGSSRDALLEILSGAFFTRLPVYAKVCLVLFGLFVVVTFIPSLALQVRRLHDQNRSGWFLLLGFIPGGTIISRLGNLVLLVFMCIKGTRGPNRFGPDPCDPYSADVFD